MRLSLQTLMLLSTVVTGTAGAQAAADSAASRATALNYVEGGMKETPTGWPGPFILSW